MSTQDDSWQVKWQFLINQIGTLIAKKGMKIVLMNVEAMRNTKKQFDKYMKTCQSVKDKYEIVVSTGLPGEERIFWPSQDVQFYIRDGDERIHATGNSQVIQEVLNTSKEPINTDVPDMDFWKYDKLTFHLDTFNYVDESKLFEEDFKLNLPQLLKKYQYQQTNEFEAKDNWYLLKFLFIGSYFQNLEGFGDLIGGIPKGLKIKCSCGDIIDLRWTLKGILEFPEYNHKHEYYLSISETCENCGTIICIYRERAVDTDAFFIPMRMFANFLDPSWNYSLKNMDLVAGWHDMFKRAASKDMERFQKLYSQDIIKFGTFLQGTEQNF